MVLLLTVEQCRTWILNSFCNGINERKKDDIDFTKLENLNFDELGDEGKQLVDSLVGFIIKWSENAVEYDEVGPNRVELLEDVAKDDEIESNCVVLFEGAYRQKAAYQRRIFFQSRQIAVDDLLFEVFLAVVRVAASGTPELEETFSADGSDVPLGLISKFGRMVVVGMRGFLRRPKFEGYEHCIMIKGLSHASNEAGFTPDDVRGWMPSEGGECDIPIRKHWKCSLRDENGQCGFSVQDAGCLDETLANMVKNRHFKIDGERYKVGD